MGSLLKNCWALLWFCFFLCFSGWFVQLKLTKVVRKNLLVVSCASRFFFKAITKCFLPNCIRKKLTMVHFTSEKYQITSEPRISSIRACLGRQRTPQLCFVFPHCWDFFLSFFAYFFSFMFWLTRSGIKFE